MPIKPIDLQTLFMQLNQVSREQSAVKRAPFSAIHTEFGDPEEAGRRSEDGSQTGSRREFRKDPGPGIGTSSEGEAEGKRAPEGKAEPRTVKS
jgi:hypothetical protein